ncbi:MAG: alpha/beta hydrolase [Acidobacteriota bacterium]|nr:alpha/beta hydrolase [Acidobacteriota bacterium]
MVDRGSGPPIVMIPGIQGRWEWMGPAITEVSKRCRVLSFSYDRTPGARMQQRGGNLDRLVDQVAEVMDAAGVEQAVICGISFGGFIATRFAARFPERTRGLVLVSSPTPHWMPNETLLKYMERPLLSMPLVLPAWFARMWPEIFAAKPSVRERVRFGCRYFGRAVRSPLSVTRMAEWARLKLATDIVADCAVVKAPALLITGEPSLDRVIDLRKSVDYVALIGARHVTLERTGHIGLVTKPELFAELVCDFVQEHSHAS